MMTREELIAALQAAKEPSESLDLAIAEWCFENGGVGGINYDPEWWVARNGGFTGSVDGTLALMPSGCAYILGRSKTQPDEPQFGAQVFRDMSGLEVLGEGESDAHLAIALLLAILQARAAVA